MRVYVLLLCACAVSQAARAGVYVESVATGKQGEAVQRTQHLYIQDGAARAEQAGADGVAHAAIFRDRALYLLEPRDKSYVVLDRDTIATVDSAVDSAMERVRKELERLPPEQRAMVEQMMAGKGLGAAPGRTPGAAPETRVEVSDTGRSDTVAGHSCRVWEVAHNGKRRSELCVVPYEDVPGKEDLRRLATDMQSLFDGLRGPLAKLGADTGELGIMGKVNGFPIRVRDYGTDGTLQSEVMLKQWRAESVPPAMFEMPPGYTKRDITSELRGSARP